MSRTARFRHPQWRERTDGSVPYTGDLRPPGLLHAAMLRSPHPHARIAAIDTDGARRSPGVHAVITAEDLPERLYTDYGTSDRPALARDTVRYIGHEVAAVAAESAVQARHALDRIKVAYEPLPAVAAFEAFMAAKPDAADEERVSVSVDRTFGQPEHAARGTAHQVTGRYRFGSQAHACMEPHTALADWDGDAGRLHLWVPTQGPRTVQREIAHMLDLEPAQVRVHAIAAGGDFGSRVRPGDIEVITAALAIRTGRPVRMSLDRSEEFAYTKHRHDFVVELTSTADGDGRLLTREADITVENGAYTHAGGNELNYCGLLLASQYRLTAARVRGAAVYTNRRPGGAFRGAGGPQAVFALESQLDELAERIGIDPIDLRLRNANRTGDTTITGWEIDSSRLAECLRTARDRIGWDAKRALAGTGRGVGIAAAMHVSGALSSEYVRYSEATVELGADGSARVRTGAGDPGTGQPMVAAIIVAEQLGLEPSQIEVVYEDTATTPYDPGAGASKGTFMTGSAALAAGRAAAGRLRELAAGKFGVPDAEVQLTGGRVHAGADSVSIGDLVAAAPDTVDGLLSVHRRHTVDMPLADDPSGTGNLSPTYAFAATAVEVEVDPQTGTVRVLRVEPVHDSGRIINPTAAGGQVAGGVAMGLGAALGEELIYADGRLANGGYTEYALPRAADMPHVDPVFLESDEGCGPLGAKGLAEIALSPVPAAIANAVAHAVGVRIRDLPITPDKVLAALTEQQGRRPAPRRLRNPHRVWISAIRWAYPRGLHSLLHRYGTRLARPNPPARPMELHQAPTPEDAIQALEREPAARPLGGGTDLLTSRKQGLRPENVLVDLTTIPELTRISISPGGDLVIGAAATLAQLAEFATGHGADALAATIDTIASPQLRSTATVAGNLCQEKRCWFFRNGFSCYKRGGATCPCYAVLGDHRFYHAALGAHRCQATTPSDLATTLTALDAMVRIHGRDGTRELPISRLYRGPGETVLAHDEVITHLVVPAAARRRRTVFEKLRLYDGGFALVSVCASVQVDDRGTLTECRAVLGGIAPTPYRATASERALTGLSPTDETLDRASTAWTSEAHPLPGNAWKTDAAAAMLARCLRAARD